MVNIEEAKLDPASVFKSPQNVIKDNTLTRSQKIDILRRWAYDAREIAVAEEENMQGKNDSGYLLDEILKALLELGVEKEVNAPTKQG